MTEAVFGVCVWEEEKQREKERGEHEKVWVYVDRIFV